MFILTIDYSIGFWLSKISKEHIFQARHGNYCITNLLLVYLSFPGSQESYTVKEEHSKKIHLYFHLYFQRVDALLLKQMPKKQTGFVLLLKQNKSDLVFHHQN